MASHCTEATQIRAMDGGAYSSSGFPFLQPSLLYIIQSQSLVFAEVCHFPVKKIARLVVENVVKCKLEGDVESSTYWTSFRSLSI